MYNIYYFCIINMNVRTVFTCVLKPLMCCGIMSRLKTALASPLNGNDQAEMLKDQVQGVIVISVIQLWHKVLPTFYGFHLFQILIFLHWLLLPGSCVKQVMLLFLFLITKIKREISSLKHNKNKLIFFFCFCGQLKYDWY